MIDCLCSGRLYNVSKFQLMEPKYTDNLEAFVFSCFLFSDSSCLIYRFLMKQLGIFAPWSLKGATDIFISTHIKVSSIFTFFFFTLVLYKQYLFDADTDRTLHQLLHASFLRR